MTNFYTTIIEPFLSNTIIAIWVAPIIVTLVSTLIIYIVKLLKNEAKKRDIKYVNEKILNEIRPFIIQQIAISIDDVDSIRKSIAREKNIKLKNIYSFSEIKDKLILDIAETRFLKETEKLNLFNLVNSIFCINNSDINKESELNEQEEEIALSQDMLEAFGKICIINIIFFVLLFVLNEVILTSIDFFDGLSMLYLLGIGAIPFIIVVVKYSYDFFIHCLKKILDKIFKRKK